MSALILQTFDDIAPCGEDYKYDDKYIAIENEIDNSISLIDGVSTNWSSVISGTEEVLGAHSKDVKLASWWLFGLWKLESWSGLERGIPLVNELLQTYTTKLFPKSPRAKTKIFNWLDTVLSEEIFADNANLKDLQNPAFFLEAFSTLEKNIQVTCNHEERFARKVVQALEKAVADAKPKEVIAPVVKKVVKPVVSATTQVSVIENSSDATKVLRDLKKSALLLSGHRYESTFGDVQAIRLSRFVLWLEEVELPVNDGGKTLINPPSEASVSAINDLIDEGDFEAAFLSLEGVLKFAPYWFDGHCLASEILEKASQKAAALEVKLALRHFVDANAGVLLFSFNEGTPFASAKTRQWVGETQTQELVEVVAPSANESKDDIVKMCQKLINKNSKKEAMALVQEQYANALTKEEKFQWRLTHAQIAISCAKKEIALALMESLLEEIERHCLDEWQPELAAKVYLEFLESFNQQQVEREKLELVYARLCKIDSALAIDIIL